jgi:hypothetical protein
VSGDSDRGVSDSGNLEALVLSLWRARRTRERVNAANLSEVQACYVMGRLLQLALDSGETVIGWKLGLTNRAQRKNLGATHPFVAPVFASSLEPAKLQQMRAPKLEVEFVGQIASGSRSVVDSWKIGIELIATHLPGPLLYPFLVADWGLHASASIGTACHAPLPGERVTLRITTPVNTAHLEGAVPEYTNVESLFDAATVDWPRRVVAGDLVWTGSLGQPVPITHPGTISAEVDGFGMAELELEQ